MALASLVTTTTAIGGEPLGAPFGGEENDFRPRALIAWGNDQFYVPDGDDQGFTNTMVVGAFLLKNDDLIGLRASYRQLTERDGTRRTDDVVFTVPLLREIDAGGLGWTYGPHIGLALSGNYGGRELQDSFHHLIGMGRTLEPTSQDPYGTLQADYTGGKRAGLLIGVRGGPRIRFHDNLSLVVGVLAQGTVGATGVSLVSGYTNLEFEVPAKDIGFTLSAGLDSSYYFTHDPGLTLAGGYRISQFQFMPHFRFSVRTDMLDIGWDGRSNVEGAGSHTGYIYGSVGGGPRHRSEHDFRWR